MALYEFEGRKPRIDPTAWVAPSADLIGEVRVGPNCYLGWNSVLRADNAAIIVEEGSALEEGVLIHVLPEEVGGGCRIGRQATIGHGAMLHNCTIEEFAVVGLRAVVCNHARIGRWSIIGEMGLVISRQEVPPESIAVGQPVEVIGRTEDRHRDFWLAGKKLYQDYARRNAAGLRELRPEECRGG